MGKLKANFFPVLLLAAGAGLHPALALEVNEEDFHVGGYMDNGRFQLADSSLNGEVISRLGARWILGTSIDEHWSVNADLHWIFWRNQATDIALFHIAGLKFDSDVQAAITYDGGAHSVRFGLYNFKYNPDAKNLGEYLLRSEAYPTIVENSQGKDLLAPAYARVAGFEHDLDFRLFRHRALVYAEQHNVPVNDINLAYLTAFGPETAELGLGVAYHRAFKLGKPQNATVLAAGVEEYVESQGLDTRAVKVSLRGRLDIGAMAGSLQGFKIYGEAALLGLRNDSLYYKEPLDRLPVMLGTELPTFGWLNALSLEMEYFANPYLERKYPIKDATGGNFSPLPFIDDYSTPPQPYTKDDLKWSIFLHKALNNWIDLKFRFASDHLRLLNWDGDFEGGSPLTRKIRDWYFLARIEYHN